MTPTDLELWQAFCLRPGEETFRPVYEETKALVQTLCLRILKDDAETRDAFQSTYCRLLLLARQREKAAEVDDFRRLIGRLAIREADRLRKRRDRRSRKERAVDAMENVPAEDREIEDAADRADLRSRVERMVETLPEDQRLPLYLHYFHGLSQREVARSLGESSSTVSYRIRQGVKRLRTAMATARLGDASKVLGGIALTARLVEPAQSAEAVYASAVHALAGSGALEWTSDSVAGGSTSSVPSSAVSLLKIKSTWIAAALALAAVLLVMLREDGGRAVSTEASPGDRSTTLPGDSISTDARDASGAGIEEEEDDAGGRLDIRVVWKTTGEPVAGAAVSLRAKDGDRISTTGSTGDTGQLTLETPKDRDTAELVVDHDHAVRQSMDVSLPVESPLTVELEERGLVRGVVRDTNTKGPIPGAVVRVGEREFVADEEGVYAVTGFARGKLSMTASAEGYADVPATLNVDPEDPQYKDFFLDPAVEIVIEVVDRAGAPIAGAKVVRAQYGCDWCFHMDDFEETDREGRAILRKISRLSPPNLGIYKDGYENGTVRKERLRDRDGDAIRVVLEPPVFLERAIVGRITDLRGKPIAGVAVQYKDGQSTSFGPGSTHGEIQAESDARGFYRLEFEDDFHECHLAVGGPGWSPVVRRNVRPGTPEEPAEVDFTLEPGHWLEGVVVDEADRPIAGVRMHAMPEKHLLNEAVAYPVALRRTKTDATGFFRLDDVSGPTVALFLMGPPGGSWPYTEMEDVPVDQEVRLTLKGYGVLRGRVLDDATGDPVTELNVKLDGYGIATERVDPGESFSSPSGEFVLRNLEQGDRFGVIVEAEGYVDGYVKDAEVVSESSAEEIEIRLSRGRLLEGRVVDAVTGRPVRGADLVFGVYRWNADIDWTVLENSRAFLNQQKSSTGDDGAFRFREVDPGVLFVRAPDYCRRIVEPEGRAEYRAGPGSLVIPLAPAEELRGVLALDGRPLADTGVSIARLVRRKVESGAAAVTPGEPRSETDEGLSREWVGYLKTDEHGEAAWNEIPAGAYLMDVLLITHPEQKQGVHIRRRFEVRPGVENRIEFSGGLGGLSFKGRLLDPDGRPADNVTLTIRPEFRWDYFELAFDISARNRGEFHFPRLEPGRYEVEAVEYSETERATRLGTIELAEDTTRDLVLEDARRDDE